MLDAVVLSDLHLGSDNCQAKYLKHFLETITHKELDTARLILNGDVFDSMNFPRLKKNHWKVLSLLRKLANHIEVIWIAGNHDGPTEFISHLLGISVQDEYILTSGENKILFLHGHVFDDFIDGHPYLTILGDWIYLFLQWIDKSHSFAKLAKRNSKIFLRCAGKVRDGAVALAQEKGCDSVCCGHTHASLADTDIGIRYYNSGCWTELPCTYLTVENGKVDLYAFDEVCDKRLE